MPGSIHARSASGDNTIRNTIATLRIIRVIIVINIDITAPTIARISPINSPSAPPLKTAIKAEAATKVPPAIIPVPSRVSTIVLESGLPGWLPSIPIISVAPNALISS